LDYFAISYHAPLPFPNAKDPPFFSGKGLEETSGQFLKAAISTKSAVQMMKLTKRQMEVTMFDAGMETLAGLQAGKLVAKSDEK